VQRRADDVSGATRADAFQRRHEWAGYPLAVIYKYLDDTGGYLAALITYYAFVSLFPLLLLASTVLGWVLVGHPGLERQVLDSALAQFPVVGKQIGSPKQLGGGVAGLVIGLVGSLYGGLGVAQAVQYAMNTAWSIPRNDRPNPFKARGRSLLLLLTAGITVLGTTVLSVLGSSDAGSLGVPLKMLVMVASVALNATAFVFVFRIAAAKSLSVRDVAVGAVAAAVIWQLLQTFGVVYVGHIVRNASDTNSIFAVVLGLLAFLYVTSVVIVICVEVNVVRVDHLYPRALLTPFTDNVQLTSGDERSYSRQAQAQRSKGFEDIDVTFDPSHDTPEQQP
jgi:membrane protein